MNACEAPRDEAMGLCLDDIELSVGSRRLLALSCQIEGGEITTVMGPSGSGKSSLLAFIAGFLDPDFRASGTLRLHGKVLNRLPAEQRRVGLLFQDAMLFPHLSVGDNLRFGLPQKTGDSQRQRDDKIEAALEALGLQDFASRDPATLSGGQQSRVALMRLLLSEPQAILLDEPFSKLDTSLKDEIRAFTFDSIRTAQIPALLVTHDKGDAESARGPLITL